MRNPGLSSRYAKSLVDLAIQLDRLEKIYQDTLLLQSLFRQNKSLISLLDNPVITAQKKEQIITEILTGKVDDITARFCQLLIRKGRETFLPQVMDAFVLQYRKIRKISLVSLTTAIPLEPYEQEAIVRKVREGMPDQQIALEAHVDPSLIGGFVLETGDRLVDASIRHGLNEIRKQFLDNSYVHKLR
jgi:F-type H+-transporting ATPase subunit delta